MGTTVELEPNWKLHIVRVADLKPGVSEAAISWGELRSRVIALDFGFGNNEKPVELYLDNVQLHGIDYDAFGFKYDEF